MKPTKKFRRERSNFFRGWWSREISLLKSLKQETSTLLKRQKNQKFNDSLRSIFDITPNLNFFFPSRKSLSSDFPNDMGWDYDVFTRNDEELIKHGVNLFDEQGLLTRFLIPIAISVNFINAIKAGYNANAPYHNYYHAFDVMHTCYLFITKCKGGEYLVSFNILSNFVGALGHDLGHDGFNNSLHAETNSEL